MANRTPARRSDRQAGGNRAAFENARKKILATQTVCGICGKPVDFSYRYPHPLSPTVDHIIPVAKGGHPSDLSNLQLAHRCCNRQKSDKLIEPRKPDELSDRIVPNDMLEQHFDIIICKYDGLTCAAKPFYDFTCKFMCHEISSLEKERESFFNNFNPNPDSV